MKWVDQTKEYTDKGYNNKSSLWDSQWAADQGPTGQAVSYTHLIPVGSSCFHLGVRGCKALLFCPQQKPQPAAQLALCLRVEPCTELFLSLIHI